MEVRNIRNTGRSNLVYLSVFVLICPPPPTCTEVWLGEYKEIKVAIKMLKDLKDEKASQKFLQEASVMT